MSKQAILVSVGGGNMASAILLGAIERGILRPDEVVVVDPNEVCRVRFAEVGVGTGEDLRVVGNRIGPLTQLMLAVKPQVVGSIGALLKEVCDGTPGRILLSIMAGVTSQRIREVSGAGGVIRLMPNTPARIGRGCTALSLGAGATEADAGLARRVFGAVGEVIDLDESLMDAFTAVAGSGPAYVFAMVEALAAAGVAAGLPEQVASIAARQTMVGGAGLLERSEQTPGELREAVTSKAGTTAAGLEALGAAGFAEAILGAVLAARDRGVELGRASGNGS
ncbi:MAG: pyrroline-5-carboxylate reductase [Phycisphaerales bacterium]